MSLERFTRTHTAFMTSLEGPFRFDIINALSEGPFVSVLATGSGTTVAGETYENSYQFQFQVRDDLIYAAWEHFDTRRAHEVIVPILKKMLK